MVKRVFVSLVHEVHAFMPLIDFDFTLLHCVCVPGCCVGPAWCRTFLSSHGLTTLRVCEWTWTLMQTSVLPPAFVWLIRFFTSRTLSGTKISSIPADLCEDLKLLRTLWDTLPFSSPAVETKTSATTPCFHSFISRCLYCLIVPVVILPSETCPTMRSRSYHRCRAASCCRRCKCCWSWRWKVKIIKGNGCTYNYYYVICSISICRSFQHNHIQQIDRDTFQGLSALRLL